MNPFFDTIHCTGGVHCPTCRDRGGGRHFRRAMAKRFGLDEVDFDCPHGRPWGAKKGYPLPRVSDLPAWVSDRVGACRDCEDRDCPMKIFLLKKPCHFSKRVKNPAIRCPRGRWETMTSINNL